MAKLTVPTCMPWANMQKRPRWPRHQTYGSGVKGQKRSNFKQRQTAKLTMPTCRPWASMQKCPRWPRRQTYGSGVKGQKKVKFQTTSNCETDSANGCVPVISDDSCLVSSSGNTRFSHISLHPILTKLGHNDRYLDHYSGTKDGGVRGHHGVTGVKKVICTKKASSPSDYVALTGDLCICSSLTPSTKVMVLKNCQGSFGVTGVKSSFSQKRHQVLQIM